MEPESKLIESFAELYRLLLEGERLDEFWVNRWSHSFLMEIFRSKLAPETKMPTEIREALRYIEQNLDDTTLDVEKIARRSGLSKYHFSRVFKSLVGQSPNAWLQNVRLHRAVELLETTDLPIKQVSRMVGFKEVSYFSNVFKRHIRFTPRYVRVHGRGSRLVARD